jgi:chorismate dehydratase
MDKVKISAISYLNSIPFVYALENSSLNVDFSLDIPSVCGDKLLSGESDLALVPVGILPQLKDYHIVSPFCISANGPVQTVCLFSDVPLNQIEEVLLDYHSKTSIQLVKILCDKFWKISPKFTSADQNFETSIAGSKAGVIIGDRSFEYCSKFKYVYDLSEQWKLFTDLPFVFACWVSTQKLDADFESNFSKELALGLDSLDQALEEKKHLFQTKIDKRKYLTDVISYQLNDEKKKAMKLFLEFIS